jgi:hypothetical protein
MPISKPVDYGLTLIVIILGIFAIIEAQGILRLILAAVLLALLFVPSLGLGRALSWIVYIGRVIFGLGCYIYLKTQDFWSFGR